MLDIKGDEGGPTRPATRIAVSSTPLPAAEPTGRRRDINPWFVLAGVSVLMLTFGAGVLTGVIGASPRSAADPVPAAKSPAVLDETLNRIADSAARPVDREALERAAVQGMVKAVGDPWSRYLEPSQYTSFRDAMEGRYSGIGVWLRAGTAVGAVSVASVSIGSPAARAGLREDDVVVRVDGVLAADDGVGGVANALRGKPGSTVAVTIRRDGSQQVITVTRDSVDAADVTIEQLRGGIAVVRVSSFTRAVGAQVRAALAQREGELRGVVLDLRGNSGGLLDEAAEVAGAFLDGGDVVTYERRGSSPIVLRASAGGDVQTPLVVLVDRGTASASEVVAAALQDRNRAVVVGDKTFGKGSVQEPIELADGSAIELTVGTYRTPSGRSIDGVGVSPDVAVSADSAATVAESRAVDVLNGLIESLPGGGS